MTIEPGQRVRTLLELVADDNAVLPEGTVGHVIGYQGERFVVSVHDMDSDTSRTFTCEKWEVRRA